MRTKFNVPGLQPHQMHVVLKRHAQDRRVVGRGQRDDVFQGAQAGRAFGHVLRRQALRGRSPLPQSRAGRAIAPSRRGRGRRYARRSAGIVQQVLHQLVGGRQFGGIGQADQHHLAGQDRTGGVAHLEQPLHQDLPGAGERGDRQLVGQRDSAFGLARAAVEKTLRAGRDLDAGQEMHRFQQVLDHRQGVGACVI